MSYTAGITLACAALAILIALLHQTWAYTRGRQLLSQRQFAYRITNGLLLLATIGMIFYGSYHRFADLRVVLVYWLAITLLPLVVVVLAMLDLRELRRTRHVRQAELYQELADLQQTLRQKRSEKQ